MQNKYAEADVPETSADRNKTYRKVMIRLLPMLLACYVANYIDRTNIGIAQIHLRQDLGFSAETYGIGVGLFFIGFIIFEVPSNILLDRIGARKTLLRIMISWGLISTLTMFVQTPLEFYVARILLGMAEAGFFPGVLLYLTYWFPSARRTRVTGLFFIGIPLSGMIGSPISGWIMHTFNGTGGMHGWQWLFLLEGIPAILLGIVAFLVLKNDPAEAKFLSPQEKALIAADLCHEQAQKTDKPGHNVLSVLLDPRVYVLGLVGCGTYTLANAVGYWTPLIINASGVKNILNIGILAGLPPLFGIFVMICVGWHSDRRLERRWHAAGALFVAVFALLALSRPGNGPYLTVMLIALMTAAHYSALTVFWSVPSVYLSERNKASGIAVVTAIGSIAGALSPIMLGWIRVKTGSLGLGLQISAGIIVIAALILLIGIPASKLREQSS